MNALQQKITDKELKEIKDGGGVVIDVTMTHKGVTWKHLVIVEDPNSIDRETRFHRPAQRAACP